MTPQRTAIAAREANAGMARAKRAESLGAEWRAGAACRDTDPGVFYPAVSVDAAYRAAYRAAQWVCADCPVREACLEYALAARDVEGVWGGTTPDQRRAMLKRAGAGRGR